MKIQIMSESAFCTNFRLIGHYWHLD